MSAFIVHQKLHLFQLFKLIMGNFKCQLKMCMGIYKQNYLKVTIRDTKYL